MSIQPHSRKSSGRRPFAWAKTLAITVLCVLGISSASSQSMEVGYHYDHRGHAAFAYVTTDFSIGYWGSVGLWFSPSLEVTISPSYIDAWLQAQFLIDAPAFTISARGKVEMIDGRQRAEARIGLLLGR